MDERELLELRIYCNSCRQPTNHQEKFRHKADSWDEDYGFKEVLTHRLWMCMGCQKFVLEETYWNEAMGDDDGLSQLFPKRSHNALTAKEYTKLKPKLVTLYKEAITCYNEGALILCAVGMRSLLEGICSDKRVHGQSLKKKINNLQPRLPNRNIIRNLHHFRFMGNEAVHELAAPKATELALAISVIEDLLNFFYELDYKASRLREMGRVSRKKRAKSKSFTHGVDMVVDVPEPAKPSETP